MDLGWCRQSRVTTDGKIFLCLSRKWVESKRFDKHLPISEGSKTKLTHQSLDMEMNSWGKGWNEGSNKANKCSCHTAGSALEWRCPQEQGQNGGGGAPRWKLLPVSFGWSCQGGIRGGWNLPAWTARCVWGCPLHPGTAPDVSESREEEQPFHRTFPRPQGVTADRNR